MKSKIALSIASLLGLLLLDGAAAIHTSRHFGSRTRRSHHIYRQRQVDADDSPQSFSVDINRNNFRGGDCSDSTPALFAKVGFGAAVESGLLYALLNLASKANTKLVKAVEIFAVIFGSASFGSIVDNGLSAATKQVLDPNQIPGDEGWYANLKKPSWNPPGWLFPIMWLIVSKPTQYAAVWKLITQNTDKDLSIPLAVYCAHLALGDAWNKIFFGLECTGRGLAVILTFWSVLLLSAYAFYQVDQYAGLLLVPTCLWVTVATALNWSIFALNKDETCG